MPDLGKESQRPISGLVDERFNGRRGIAESLRSFFQREVIFDHGPDGFVVALARRRGVIEEGEEVDGVGIIVSLWEG